MGFFESMEITASGMSAQRTRMNAISSNLANMHTTRAEGGGPYRRKQVVLEAAEPDSFREILEGMALMGEDSEGFARKVEVRGVFEDASPPMLVHDPGHPDADEDGMVAMPDISIMEEMVDMITAQRAYESNLMAMRTTREMVEKAIEIIR